MLEVPSWAWILWGAVSFISFLALEVIALTSKPDTDTLSAFLRRALGVDPAQPIRQVTIPLFVATIVGFIAWSVPHIVLVLW